MSEICPVCGREFDGFNCLKCTQQAMSIVGFGNDLLSYEAPLPPGVTSRHELKADGPKVRLEDGSLIAVSKPVCRIGQDTNNDLVISEDPGVGKFHAQIQFEDGKYIISDLGTKIGIEVDGEKVLLEADLKDGSIIQISNYKLCFVSDI